MTETTKAIADFAPPIQDKIVHHPFPGEPAAITPMELLQIAVNKDADIGKREKLMELQLRWEANEARKAFVAAMNEFKTDPPEILKNKIVSFGNTSYSYATLDNVCKQVTNGLSQHGISHRWRIEQTDALIRVTCVLTHDLGHSEETTLVAGADMSGSKNAIQGIGSAVTYLERYTLLAATGLAAANGDDDGHGTQAAWPKLQEFLDSMATSPNLKVLEETYKAGFKEAMAINNTDAMKRLAIAKDARKKAIQQEEQA
jgi:hypothetical protein